jgi:hypothetical protein
MTIGGIGADSETSGEIRVAEIATIGAKRRGLTARRARADL